MWSNVPLFPPQASTMSGQVDQLFLFLCLVSAFFASLIAVSILFFMVKYRRTAHPKASPIEGSLVLEGAWTFIPLGISMIMFVWGANIYYTMSRPPRDSMEIYGVAKQWMWKFEHIEGQREINELHVPVDRDVKVTLTSQDVIHSFFVPAFRVKGDVLPGRYTTVWFRATQPGRYHLFCSQYCGTMHSGMIGEIVVMTPADYARWLGGGGEGSMAQNGEKLFQQLGCLTCHRSDSGARGPNLAGLYGQPVTLADGTSVVADDSYLRESILYPSAKQVAGYQNIMPNFQGQISEDGLLTLLEYIKSIKNVNPGQPPTNRTPAAVSPNETKRPKP
jgi:cytochrome c oxidase subunit II